MTSKLEQEIIKDYHAQFAQNQNHHQSLMVKFLVGFIALIVVFSYATLNQITYLESVLGRKDGKEFLKFIESNKFIISNDFYYEFSVFLVYVFSFLFLYICQVAYAYRRDLKIIRRIRAKHCLESKEIFEDYGSRKLKVLWPPDFFLILLGGIFVLSISLGCWVISFLNGQDFRFDPFIFPIVFMVIFYIFYMVKYWQNCIE